MYILPDVIIYTNGMETHLKGWKYSCYCSDRCSDTQGTMRLMVCAVQPVGTHLPLAGDGV